MFKRPPHPINIKIRDLLKPSELQNLDFSLRAIYVKHHQINDLFSHFNYNLEGLGSSIRCVNDYVREFDSIETQINEQLGIGNVGDTLDKLVVVNRDLDIDISIYKCIKKNFSKVDMDLHDYKRGEILRHWCSEYISPKHIKGNN